jgi:hypothetical protein
MPKYPFPKQTEMIASFDDESLRQTICNHDSCGQNDKKSSFYLIEGDGRQN